MIKRLPRFKNGRINHALLQQSISEHGDALLELQVRYAQLDYVRTASTTSRRNHVQRVGGTKYKELQHAQEETVATARSFVHWTQYAISKGGDQQASRRTLEESVAVMSDPFAPLLAKVALARISQQDQYSIALTQKK
jgi:hypothetical protein